VFVARAKLILAIDQGTTNTKALLIDHTGAIRAAASRPLAIAFPQSGWVEQDARALWTSVTEAMNECLQQAGDSEIAAVGVTNQRESVVVWDRRTGEPMGPCVIWQCRRTAAFCEQLRQRDLQSFIRDRSGLPIDPLFSGSKIRWLLDSIPDGIARASAGELCAGTVDSWLLWNLTGGAVHSTDVSNASRTQLLNLRECRWDVELLKIFGIPEACLPRVCPSSQIFGSTNGIPVASLIGDSHAALFGHAAFSAGAVKATYGTGSSLMTPTDSPIASAHGLSTTIAWSESARVRYALEGNITNTGGAVQWLADFLSLPDGADGVAALAAGVPDAGGTYLVPAFAGLGAPHWDANARGVICGLTRGATPAHVARATLDSIAYQVFDVFEALCKDAAISAPALFADGGASRNDRLMQFQADILACPVIRSSSTDLSCLGAAWLAGLAIGYWKSLDELAGLPRPTTRFEPTMPEARRAELIRGWRDALHRSRSAAGTEAGG
jgi:glycerol kinase